jgi:hypothetical protein
LGVALAQTSIDTGETHECAALKALLGTLELEGVLIQAVGAAFSAAEGISKRRSCPPHLSPFVELAAGQGADLLLTDNNNQRRLDVQIVSQFRGHRHFPVESTNSRPAMAARCAGSSEPITP